MLRFATILIQLTADTLRWCGLAFRSKRSIEAENLFLRRQLALHVERGVKQPRVDQFSSIALALLSRFFNWRDAPGDDDPLASSGVDTVLAAEVAIRSSADSD
jgi:hypothetical protein